MGGLETGYSGTLVRPFGVSLVLQEMYEGMLSPDGTGVLDSSHVLKEGGIEVLTELRESDDRDNLREGPILLQLSKGSNHSSVVHREPKSPLELLCVSPVLPAIVDPPLSTAMNPQLSKAK
jgi:hypothetical protein